MDNTIVHTGPLHANNDDGAMIFTHFALHDTGDTTTPSLIRLLRIARSLLLLNYDIRIRILRSLDSLDVATDDTSVVGVRLLAFGADLVEFTGDETMAADGAPVGRRGESADDAGADEDGEVESVLGVPSRG